MESPVIHNLAKAMVDLALGKRIIPVIRQTAEELLPKLTIAEVRLFLLHPVVMPVDKKELCRNLIGADAPQEFINFLNLIIDRGYARLLPNILEKTAELAIKAQGYEMITVVSAKELASKEEELIRRDLEKRWSTRVFLKKRVNPNLIGGVVIQRDDRLYDGSILGKINQLRGMLTE